MCHPLYLIAVEKHCTLGKPTGCVSLDPDLIIILLIIPRLASSFELGDEQPVVTGKHRARILQGEISPCHAMLGCLFYCSHILPEPVWSSGRGGGEVQAQAQEGGHQA